MHQLFILVSIPKDSMFCSLYKQIFLYVLVIIVSFLDV